MNQNIRTRATLPASFYASLRANAPIANAASMAGMALHFSIEPRVAIARLREIDSDQAPMAISYLEAILAAEVRETEPPLAMVVGGVR